MGFNWTANIRCRIIDGKAFLIALSNTDHVIVDFAGVLKIDRSFADQFKQARTVSRRLGEKMTPVNISHRLLETIA